MAHLVTMDTWVAACLVKRPPGRLWLRSWSRQHRGHVGRLSGAGENRPFFTGFARAEFGLAIAASGIAASRENVLGGRVLSPRKGGARLYIVTGTSREATQ